MNWSIYSTTCGPRTRTNCSKCAENKYSHEVPIKTAIPNCTTYRGDTWKKARFLGRRPVPLVLLPSRVGGNLTATRRCGSTTPANPSDGRSGYRAPPASGQLPGNQHGKTKEERREGGSKQPKDRPDAPPAGAGT